MSDQVPLTEIPEGSSARVVEVVGGGGVRDRLKALGIRVGVSITKVSGSFVSGPIVVGHGQTQTALGRGITQQPAIRAR